MPRFALLAVVLLASIGFAAAATPANAEWKPEEKCARPAAGSVVSDAADLRSVNGTLSVKLFFRSSKDANGRVRYCYVTEDGVESPTLRVHPGDWLVVTLKNEVNEPQDAIAGVVASHTNLHHPGSAKACAGGGLMASFATNLHFHGLEVPPTCHQDEVLTTSILPSDGAYEYRVQIPKNQPPGLYWYHPHLHGFSKVQVLGGASGALIVGGIERANQQLAGLPERVLVIRDEDLLNPNAPPASGAAAPAVVLDADGDARNTGDGSGMPAKDLSVNFVPVPYPNYPPAVIQVKPRERQLWRVLNASAITYLNLQILYRGVPQWMAVVGLDGVPLNYDGHPGNGVAWQTHVGLPPGGRSEFVVTAPGGGVETLVTRSVDTGVGGENDPLRQIASILVSADAPETRSKLAASPPPMPAPSLPWLGTVTPVRTRKLYFSETQQDPRDPSSPTTFFITAEGQKPAAFDPNSNVPIVVRQGDVEDWIIENRSQELHAFHIHQIHFVLMERAGVAVNEPFLRDTINVPFWDGKTENFPSVKLRMDFRNPEVVGTFPFHCHLLEHEDGGMMGLVRVEPREALADGAAGNTKSASKLN
jgi:FtsP/CotA-like multicopper oxidase with cupredoxin domain